MIFISGKYFKALLQVVISNQINLFKNTPTREKLLRDIFENGFFIEGRELNSETGWGIGDTKYLGNNDEWIFGFLYKVVENPNITTLPFEAISLKDISNLDGRVVLCTPFFFNFAKQHIYTQSHGQITRSSNSSSEIWKKILDFKLQEHIYDLDVRSIPEASSFWAKMGKMQIVQKAEFDLFGPNILNDETIGKLIEDFQPTGSKGISILLKNYVSGLKVDAAEIILILKYLLKGGGRGTLFGLDSKGAKKIVRTESQLEEISVSHKLGKKSNENEVDTVFIQIVAGVEEK